MARERRSPPPRTDLPPGPPLPRWTNEAMAALGDRYPGWVRAIPRGEPAYAIPEEAIQGPALERVFDEERLTAEREFSRVCREHGIVGVWGRDTVAYHHLTRRPLQVDQLPLDNPAVQQLGWSGRELGLLRIAAGRGSPTPGRLLGVIGWLLTEPPFLADLGRLRSEYEALPPDDRPQFPLGRAVVLEGPAGQRTELPPATVAFAADLRTFLDRWGLIQLATWDLPDPQGPLLPDLLPADAPARPAHGVHLFVPVHYPLQGDDDLLRRVREFQRQRASELGLDAGFGGVAHHAQYAQMFRLIHLDWAVRGRFPGRAPRGLVSATEAAASAYLGIGGESVRRLWKWVRACRAGRRATIPRLRD